MSECDHRWIGDVCTNCGVLYRVHLESDITTLTAALAERDERIKELELTWQDGYCPRCSTLSKPLTDALAGCGVPTGATNWQGSWALWKLESLSNAQSAMYDLRSAIKIGTRESIDRAMERTERIIAMSAEKYKRLLAKAALAQFEGKVVSENKKENDDE